MEDVTNIFKMRLRELRSSRTQTEVAKAIGISRAALSYYETGERAPDINVLYSIAKYYDVSTDYLLGMSDIPKPDIETTAIAQKIGLSEASIEYLTYLAKRAKAESINDVETAISGLLSLQIVNLILGSSYEFIENFMCFLFVSFTHFGKFYDGEEYLPIYDLELYDYRLKLEFSQDYDFYSNAFLLTIEKDLQELREHYSHKMADLFYPYDKELSEKEVYEKLKLFFKKI